MENLKYYLEHTTQTMNGIVFKDEDAFKNRPDDPCYISEDGLEALESALEDGQTTVQDLIDNGEIATYNTILQEVIDRYDEIVDDEDEDYGDMTVQELAEIVFNESDWTYISTTIDQMTY